MNPHLNRLRKDYEQIQALAAQNPAVIIESVSGNPPDTYWLCLNCKGIVSLTPEGNPMYAERHRLSVRLPEEYPRKGPLFQMLTPIYHPNIARDGLACIVDLEEHGWAPSVQLDKTVLKVIQMIRYERADFQSPFNPEAAAWAKKNENLFPLSVGNIATEE